MGLEDFRCFADSIRRCPDVPWDIDREHLEAIDSKIDELKKEQREQKKPHYIRYSIPVIRRSKKKYLVLVEGITVGRYERQVYDYDLALFHEAEFVDVLSLSSLACNAHRLKKEIISENKKEFENSPYMEKLNSGRYSWNRSEIPTDKRSIKELEEVGVSVVALTRNDYGIPNRCFGHSEAYLRSQAFLMDANYIVGYHRTIHFDKDFPFIHIAHGGYPVIISPIPNPKNPTA